MKDKIVTLIPGDGIGPEIVQAVRKIFRAAGVPIKWEVINAGQTSFEESGELLPEKLLESIRTNKVALKAPLTTPVGEGFRSVNVQLRKELDLYANIRPIRTIEGVQSPLRNGKDINLTIVRENTEGLYAGIENMVGEDAAQTLKIFTRNASDRILRKAFNIAIDDNFNRRKVTVVHKANIMKLTDGEMFLNIAKDLYRQVEGKFDFDDKIVDNMSMQLISNPQNYDIIVTSNLYGDILSDACAALVGGLGVAPGANIGRNCAIYEAIHGTAPDIAGQGKANPTSLLLSACMMLRDHNLGMHEYADRIEDAIFKTLKKGDFVTGDIIKEDGTRGTAGTGAYTDAIIENIKVPAIS
jgi:isocitrate dehydrogenase (NAD+)